MAQVIDQFSDAQHHLLVRIAKENPDVIKSVKTASTTPDESLPSSAFAWPEARLFPWHTPEQALLSRAYAEKQASVVPTAIIERLDRALDVYGVTFQTEKQASAEQPSQDYLLPQHKRLLFSHPSHAPFVGGALVEQADRLKVATLAQAATGFVKKAADMGLGTKDVPTDVMKYAGLTPCDAGVLLDWIEARAIVAPTLEKRATYDKMALAVKQNFPRDGVISDRDELIKIATALEAADEEAGLTHLYGRTLLNPLASTFNMDKVATQTVKVGNRQVPLSKLMQVPEDVYDEILGPGSLKSAMVNDQLDPESFGAMIGSLPADLSSLLGTYLSPYL